MTRGLLVDLGNVLVRFDHDITVRKIASATGAEPGTIRTALFEGHDHELDAGRVTPMEFFRAAERRAGLPRLPDETWIEAWRDIFTPIPETLGALARRRPEVRAVLVSNTNSVHWDGVKRVAKIEELVQGVALSFAVRSAKPEPAIFEAALERIGLPASKCLFADDRPDFVEGAARLGIPGVVVDRPGTFVSELERRGLLLPE